MDAITRKEKIISGENLEPLTREEWFLKEYGGGGGGGTTVVANPSGTASADLTKLQVGNDIYGVPSGGGAGRFIVVFVYDENDNSYTCESTLEEISDAYDSGSFLVGRIDNGDDSYCDTTFYTVEKYEGSHIFIFIFAGVSTSTTPSSEVDDFNGTEIGIDSSRVFSYDFRVIGNSYPI